MSRKGRAARIAVPATTVGLLIGGLLGFAVANPWAPESLRASSKASTVSIVQKPFSDSRDVRVALTLGGKRLSSLNTDGTVTSATCVPGEPVPSGSSPLSINGQPIIALATTTPLWRSITPGTTGDDVQSLHAALKDLGTSVPSGHTANSRTIAAFGALVREAGGAPPRGSIPLSGAVWVPPGDLPLVECTATLGGRADGSSPIMTFPPDVVGMKLVAVPTRMTDGDRVLAVDGEEFPVNGSGELKNNEDFAKLRELPSYAAALRSAESPEFTAKLRLAESKPMAVVPPAAVIGTEEHCVVAGGDPHRVEVIGGQIGQSYVTFIDGEAPQTVDTAPDPDACT